MVLRGDTSEATLSRAASAIGWNLPDDVVVVTVPFSHADGLRTALGPDALVVERGAEVVVLLPFGNRLARTRDLKRALTGRRAIIGPPRPLATASESLHLAVAAGAHGLGGVGTGGSGADGLGPADDPSREGGIGAVAASAGPSADRERPFWVVDHLAELIVRAEPLATADLADRVLAPLADVRAAARERLVETLFAWLRHHGQWAPVAAELFVHPQTVGYRLGQLRELFGAALEDPQARFELELVLRAGHR
ncbi:MAG: helix-turn-helix domain-containing protein [Micrococcales bacterium]|nr:helix-turn-helix domain-containing protein [Micrococcales bacterium]